MILQRRQQYGSFSFRISIAADLLIPPQDKLFIAVKSDSVRLIHLPSGVGFANQIHSYGTKPKSCTQNALPKSP